MILKSKSKTFVNDFGRDEVYDELVLESYMSGHLYRGSLFETDDSCGNCDGARCDSCKEVYVLTEYNKPILVEDKYGCIYEEQTVRRCTRYITDEDKKKALKLFD